VRRKKEGRKEEGGKEEKEKRRAKKKVILEKRVRTASQSYEQCTIVVDDEHQPTEDSK